MRAIMGVVAAAWLAGLVPPARAGQLQSESGPIEVTKLADLENPWGMELLPDGRVLLTEKPGRIRILDGETLSEPVKGVPKVVYQGNSGLLDVALDPDFARNGRIYIFYVEIAARQPRDNADKGDPRLGGIGAEGDGLKGGVVLRARLDGMHLRDRVVIWRQAPKEVGRGQFGGRLLFAPDGTLLITSGDRQYFDTAQDPSGNLGSIVRIRTDGSIPADNPFATDDTRRREAWTFGHRNPLGIAFDPATGFLWEHEMGPQGGDELNILKRGGNYGWPWVSAGLNYDDSWIARPWMRPDLVPAVRTWAPSIAPSGMAFYVGGRFPHWGGNLLLGGLVSMSLWRLEIDGESVAHEERIEIGERIRDVMTMPDGSVLLLTDGTDGAVLRLEPAGAASAAVTAK